MRKIEQEVFAKRQIQISVLQNFGFVRKKHKYIYQEKICDGAFICEVSVNEDGVVDCDCIDVMTLETYEPIYITYQNGSYVSQVRQSYVECLEKIAQEISVSLPFRYAQTNRIAQWIREVFHEEAAPFSERAKDYMTFTNHENHKLYALISTIPRHKMTGKQDELIEVLNVKANPEDVQRMLVQDCFYPAWHMNKQNWISLILDDSVRDEAIQDLLSVSRGFTLGKKGNRDNAGTHAWLIPSNPRYFNIVEAMEQNDVITWRQTCQIHAGDDVYLYVGKPFSAIMYHFEAKEVDLKYGEEDDGKKRLMVLKKLHSYDPTILTLDKMRQLGTNTPRGQRNMPDNLIEILKKKQKE